MTNKPKAIGTAAETAVVRYLNANGFPGAERRALTGAYDQGDVTGIPGVCIEVKAGAAAKTASDGQVAAWLVETETERVNARADIGILVMARSGIGPARAGQWWAVMGGWTFATLAIDGVANNNGPPGFGIVRMWLADAVHLLRAGGYGDPLPDNPIGYALTDKATA